MVFLGFPNKTSWGLLRLPKYKFRPSNADPLHFDLFHKGENILRDGGSFSYNSSEKIISYFSGIKSHNTIQFNNKEPMPRLGRFLWGNWLYLQSKPELLFTDNHIISSGSYIANKSFHQRKVIVDLKGINWTIIDKISNFDSALLRWRLCNSNWEIFDNEIRSDKAILKFSSDAVFEIKGLKKGLESLYYYDKNELEVLEIEIYQSPTIFKTVINLK